MEGLEAGRKAIFWRILRDLARRALSRCEICLYRHNGDDPTKNERDTHVLNELPAVRACSSIRRRVEAGGFSRAKCRRTVSCSNTVIVMHLLSRSDPEDDRTDAAAFQSIRVLSSSLPDRRATFAHAFVVQTSCLVKHSGKKCYEC